MNITAERKTKNRLVPYFLMGLGLLVVFGSFTTYAPRRVGDGGEYYALYYAWETNARPWMTSGSFAAVDELYTSREITGMVSRDWLENRFPALRNGATADFNHFWFYSFLAFLAGKLVSLTGFKPHIHTSFLVLHFILFFITLSISYRYYKWRGVGMVCLLAFASPMLWYFDKVHTEFFTFCLVLSSVILICAERYLPSALCLALASTQNPSFAMVALVPVFFRMVLQRKRPYTTLEVAVAAATVVAVLAHPVYYLARIGILTPQLLAGGASLGRNLGSFYIWIVDPDVGLLPNWPLGLLTLFLIISLSIFKIENKNATVVSGRWTIFLLLYLAINLYANSSTTNLNSGATPGLARYALWYLPLAWPYLYRISMLASTRPVHVAAIGAVLLIITVHSVMVNDPRGPEQYSRPSYLSHIIQSRISWAYDPPEEVFMERYSGYGEDVHSHNVRGVVGPDCRKVLVLPGNDRQDATCPRKCGFDTGKLTAFLDECITPEQKSRYIRLSDGQAHELAMENDSGKQPESLAEHR